MKICVSQLVEACGKQIIRIVQLDNILGDLFVKGLVSLEEFESIQEDFNNCVSSLYGDEFLQEFFDVCNSPNIYLDML